MLGRHGPGQYLSRVSTCEDRNSICSGFASFFSTPAVTDQDSAVVLIHDRGSISRCRSWLHRRCEQVRNSTSEARHEKALQDDTDSTPDSQLIARFLFQNFQQYDWRKDRSGVVGYIPGGLRLLRALDATGSLHYASRPLPVVSTFSCIESFAACAPDPIQIHPSDFIVGKWACARHKCDS